MRIIDGDIARKKIMDWIDVFNSEQDAFFACDLIDSTHTVDKWHYPSKGELPSRGKQVLCRLWNDDYILAFIREDDEWTTDGKNAFDGVKCWQYIIPPRECTDEEKRTERGRNGI